MNFLIITHVPHIIENNRYYAYAPYVREINLWIKHTDKVTIIAPKSAADRTPIDSFYVHENITYIPADAVDLLSSKSTLKTFLKLPAISFSIFKAMRSAGHIHLRCPGNMGLIGCVIQILFPGKVKTAKYAGNWDPESKQPFTYKLQQKLLKNTFLTKNITALVYGTWDENNKNILPFFTASYSEQDKLPILEYKEKDPINFVFAGSLVKGKNPLYAIRIAEELIKKGINAKLNLYGEGAERDLLAEYIIGNDLSSHIILQGNVDSDTLKEAYRKSQFVILPSESEGWPKAIAEGMFWGCIPISTKVSCLSSILNHGKRGLLLEMQITPDIENIIAILNDKGVFDIMRRDASEWSRQFTLEAFEIQIKQLIQE